MKSGREVLGNRYLSYSYVGPPEAWVGSSMSEFQQAGGTGTHSGPAGWADSANNCRTVGFSNSPVALETQRLEPRGPAFGGPGQSSVIYRVIGSPQGGDSTGEDSDPLHSLAKVESMLDLGRGARW